MNSYLPQVNTVGESLLIFLYVSMDFVDLKSCGTSSSLLDFVFGLPSRFINKEIQRHCRISDLIVREVMFFMWAKHTIGNFDGCSRGPRFF